MARTKKQTAAEKEASDFLKSLLAEHGIENPLPETTHGAPVTDEDLDDSPQRVLFRGQGVLRSLECPTEERLTKVCKNEDCKNVFTSNYHSVAYCSIICCEYALKKHYGLAWRPSSRIQRERWEVRAEPEMIPMRALQAMKMIVARVENDLGYPIEIDQKAFEKIPSGILKPESSSVSHKPSEPLLEEPLSSASESEQALLLSDKKKAQAPMEPEPEESDLDSWLFA
jgi:hypothetical protein